MRPAAPGTHPPPPAQIITAPPQVTGLQLPPSQQGRGAQSFPTSALGCQWQGGTATLWATLCPQNNPLLQKRWNSPKGPFWGRGPARALGEVCLQALLLFPLSQASAPGSFPGGNQIPLNGIWSLGPLGFFCLFL